MTGRQSSRGRLGAVRAAVIASPIEMASFRIQPWSSNATGAWDRIRRSANVDAFVLNWIAGHVRRSGRLLRWRS